MPLLVGATRQIHAIVYSPTWAVLPGIFPTGWSSSDPSVLSIDEHGLARGVGAGTATIRASLGTVISNALAVTVEVDPMLDQTPASIEISWVTG